MNNLFFTLALCLSTCIARAQAPDFVWAKQMGGSLNQTPVSIKLDAGGNIYTCGFFEGTVDFDPGPSSFPLTAPNAKAVYVSKLDPQGGFLWAKQISGDIQMGPSSVHAGHMAVNANGDVVVTGFFQGMVDFDPGTSSTYLPGSMPGNNTFIVKLDAQGNFTWARKTTGSESDAGNAVATDVNDNVYITGFFMDTVDFDPGVPTFTMASLNGSMEAYILKLDQSGSFVWARHLQSTSASGGNGIVVDGSGNVLSTGNFRGSTDFNPPGVATNLVSSGGQDAYIWKLDGAGTLLWARAVGGTTEDGGIDIAVDNAGNPVVSGFFTGTADLDPGTAVSNGVSVGNNDVFILKLDAQGNFLWKNAFGSTGQDVAAGLAIGTNNDVYATGQFENLVDFDPSPATLTLSALMQDVFISKWDAAGNISLVKQLQGGAALSAGSAITVDAATNIFSTGLFNATVDFDGGSSTFSLTSMGDADIYVHKMRCGSTPQLTLSSSSHVICAGNNAVLTATGASTYSWNAAPGANTLAVAPGTTTDYTVTALDVNGCAASAKITQSVEACTGLSEVVSGKGKVYPNPANEVIVVELNEKGVNSVLEITDAQGRVVLRQSLLANSTQVATDKLSPGIYFMRVNTEKEVLLMEKIVIAEN